MTHQLWLHSKRPSKQPDGSPCPGAQQLAVLVRVPLLLAYGRRLSHQHFPVNLHRLQLPLLLLTLAVRREQLPLWCPLGAAAVSASARGRGVQLEVYV